VADPVPAAVPPALPASARAAAGTYALILRNVSTVDVTVGRWGRLRAGPGHFVYVGSAFGPGGLRARVSRHFRRKEVRHWHIDYLCAVAEPLSAWVQRGPERLEHRWARVFGRMAGMSPVKGFGSSDCTCYAHLFASVEKPDISNFSEAAGDDVECWLCKP
jgi:Uri superfamily endonuclease